MCDVRQLCNLHSLSQWQAAEPEYPAEALKKRKALLKNVVSDFLFIFNMQYFSNKQAKVEYPAEKTSRPKFSILWRCRPAFLCKILLGCCAQKGAKIETLFMSGFGLGGSWILSRSVLYIVSRSPMIMIHLLLYWDYEIVKLNEKYSRLTPFDVRQTYK